jgi:photosystem II stability/assembly factor-like uncharacterized protein
LGNDIYIGNYISKILKSSDYGYSWVTINLPTELQEYPVFFHFFDNSTGIVSLTDGFYKTVDGGLNWSKTTFKNYTDWIYHFYDNNIGFLIDSYFVSVPDGDFPVLRGSYAYETTDGGITWNKSELFKSLFVDLISFPYKDFGFGFEDGLYRIRKVN